MGKFCSVVTLFVLLALLPPALRTAAAPDWQQNPEICRADDRPVSRPLTELGNDTYTRLDGQTTQFTGGLYPQGSNTRPPAHEAAGQALAAQIVPLDAAGRPDPQRGRIGLLSVGMSNTNTEFGAFMEMVHQNPQVNPRLALVNGAQPNRTAERWSDPAAPTWQEVARRLERQRLTAAQIQVAWVKQTLTRDGDFPAKTQELQGHLEAIARNLHAQFPNLKLVFFSSRTRSYVIGRGLSPEPLAFEGGFAVKWLIEKQIEGDPMLNFDPARGEVVAPYLSWGPYLWIDGTTPRTDGRVWPAENLRPDCTHPSPRGARQVAEMLFEFFATDSLTQGWFLAEAAAARPTTLATVAAPSPSVTPLGSPTPTVQLAQGQPRTPAVTPVAFSEPGLLSTPGPAPSPTLAAAALVTAPPLIASPNTEPLPERRLAPLGLAFVILLFLSGGAGVWYLLRRVRQ